LKVAILTVPYDSGHLRQRMALGLDRLLEAALRPVLMRLGHEFRLEEILDCAFSPPRPPLCSSCAAELRIELERIELRAIFPLFSQATAELLSMP